MSDQVGNQNVGFLMTRLMLTNEEPRAALLASFKGVVGTIDLVTVNITILVCYVKIKSEDH